MNPYPEVKSLGIRVSGRYAYVANGDDGVRIYDVGDLSNPQPIGHI